MEEKLKQSPKELFNTFWKELVCDEKGNILPELVQNELADYHKLMGDSSAVYEHITWGLLSKPGYDAKTVIKAANDAYKSRYIDYFIDFLNVMELKDKIDIETLNLLSKEVEKYFK